MGAEGKASRHTGRPGIAQWIILVLGAIRRAGSRRFLEVERNTAGHCLNFFTIGFAVGANTLFYAGSYEIYNRLNESVTAPSTALPATNTAPNSSNEAVTPDQRQHPDHRSRK